MHQKIKLKLLELDLEKKIHEVLCSYDESRNIKEYSNYYQINPNSKNSSALTGKMFEYNSRDNKNFYNLIKIKNILNKSKLFDKKF